MTQVPLGANPTPILIFDSSALIDMKTHRPLEAQWDIAVSLLDLARLGQVMFPATVHREMVELNHPDVPGVWAAKASTIQGVLQEPQGKTVREVLASHGTLVDQSDPNEAQKADPFVVALALELDRQGAEVVVVSKDEEVQRACQTFSIPVESWAQFLQHFTPTP